MNDCVEIRLIICKDCANLSNPALQPFEDKGDDWEKECFVCRVITTYWVDYNAWGYIESLQGRIRHLLNKNQQ